MVASQARTPDQAERHGLCLRIVSAVRAGVPNVVLDNGDEQSLEKSIEQLTDVEIGPLFADLGAMFRSQMQEAPSVWQKAEVKHRYRKLFGVRYSSMLLTSVPFEEQNSTEQHDPVLRCARAAVEESLQWHPDAVLGHVLIYYGDGSTEDLLHECAIVEERPEDVGRVKIHLERFRVALKEYVRKYGSSVRTKEHLRLATLSCMSDASASRQITPPLDAPKLVSVYSDQLQLPPIMTDIQGNQDEYRQVVWQNLGEVLALNQNHFESIHYSAGSDGVGKANIRATAHMYVVFRQKLSDSIALDYTFAMRETLARLTITFALDRMQEANQLLLATRKQEELQHKDFEKNVQALSTEIRDLQAKAEKVTSMVTPSVWASLINWVPVIDKVSSDASKEEMIGIGTLVNTTCAHNWAADQWAIALLKLVNATDSDIPASTKGAVNAWQDLSRRVLEDSANGQRIHPIWRCLHRMGIPMSHRFCKDVIGTIRPKCGNLREGFVEPERLFRVFRSNGFTVLFLLFALGAKYDEDIHGDICGTRILLAFPLKADGVIDGINLLIDLVNGKTFGGIQSTSVRFNDGRPQFLEVGITAPELGQHFANVCHRMSIIKSENPLEHPGLRSRTTSMAVFAALGLNQESWKDAITKIEIDEGKLSVMRTDEHGFPLAICAASEQGLTISYRLCN